MCFFLYNFFQFLVYINLILDAIYLKLVKKIELKNAIPVSNQNRSPPRHINAQSTSQKTSYFYMYQDKKKGEKISPFKGDSPPSPPNLLKKCTPMQMKFYDKNSNYPLRPFTKGEPLRQ